MVQTNNDKKKGEKVAFVIVVAILLLTVYLANLVFALWNGVEYIPTPRHIILLGTMIAADVFINAVGKGFHWEPWAGWCFGAAMAFGALGAFICAYGAGNESDHCRWSEADDYSSLAGTSFGIALNMIALCAAGFVAAYA